MRLPTNPGVVGLQGIDPKRLTDLLAQLAAQVNGVTEGTNAAFTNAGLAAPTTGTWAQGDYIRNRSPSGATPTLGWICTVGGTPGTWVAVTFGGGGTIVVEEVDGAPTGSIDTLVFPNGTLSIVGSEATYTPASSAGITVLEVQVFS